MAQFPTIYGQMESAITVWAESHSIRPEARRIPGKNDHPSGSVESSRPDSADRIVSVPCVFDGICREFGQLHPDPFTTRANGKLPLLFFPSARSANLEARRLTPSLKSPRRICFSSIFSAPPSHHAGHGVGGSAVASNDSTLASERVAHGPSGPSRGTTSRAFENLEPPSAASHQEVSPRP